MFRPRKLVLIRPTTHRPQAIDCRARLPLNAGHEEAPSGVLVVYAENLPLSDPLLAGAFHFQQSLA